MGPRRTRLLLVIDQLEELLTQTPAEQRKRLARLLAPAARGGVQVVATLRPEFLDPLLRCPQLTGLELGRRPFAVRPLLREALPEVIEEPSCFAVFVDHVPAAAQAARTARVSCGVACSGHGPRNLAAMMTRRSLMAMSS